MLSQKVGIDLGTANTLVCVPKKGVILNEPTVVAITQDDNKVVAVGKSAKEMLGRTPEGIVASCPLKDGVIADYRITEAMLRYFITKAVGGFRLFRPEVMIAVPAGISSTEKRAVEDASKQAGAKATYIIKEPIAAAIGAGVPIADASGNMIIDIGGGTSEVAVISLGGIVSSNSVRVAGNCLDKSIAEYIRKKHGLAVGSQTAERIKIEIGDALLKESDEKGEEEEVEKMNARGRDMIAGLPKTITVTSKEVSEAIQDDLREIIMAIKNVLQETPPELAADVMDKGMVLSGGGALLQNLDQLITKITGVPCYVADDPLLCVARGTAVALDNLDSYKRSILSAS